MLIAVVRTRNIIIRHNDTIIIPSIIIRVIEQMCLLWRQNQCVWEHAATARSPGKLRTVRQREATPDIRGRPPRRKVAPRTIVKLTATRTIICSRPNCKSVSPFLPLLLVFTDIHRVTHTYLRYIKVEHKALIIVPLISLSAPVNGSSPNGSTNNAAVLRRQKNAQISEFKRWGYF